MVALVPTALIMGLQSRNTEMEATMHSVKRGFKVAAALATFGLFLAPMSQSYAHSGGGSHPLHEKSNGHQHAHSHAAGQFPDPSKAPAPQGVRVEECWIRAMPNRLPSAGYFVLHNGGQTPVALVGVQAADFAKVMLHASDTRGGMSAMVHVDRVDIAPGERIEFAPGGITSCWKNRRRRWLLGAQRPITLWFEGDQALTVQCEVRPPSTLPKR